jgi:hypothetical protein
VTSAYEIAVAVGGIGERCGFVLLAEREGRRRLFGPYYVEETQGLGVDVWMATYAGVARACRLPLAVDGRRDIYVVLLGAVQVLDRADAATDGRAHVASAARAVIEAGARVSWVRKHESALMAAAHDALAEAGAKALREEMGL